MSSPLFSSMPPIGCRPSVHLPPSQDARRTPGNRLAGPNFFPTVYQLSGSTGLLLQARPLQVWATFACALAPRSEMAGSAPSLFHARLECGSDARLNSYKASHVIFLVSSIDPNRPDKVRLRAVIVKKSSFKCCLPQIQQGDRRGPSGTWYLRQADWDCRKWM